MPLFLKNVVYPFVISVCVITLIVASVYWLRYESYLERLPRYELRTSASYKEPVFPLLTKEQDIAIGWAHRRGGIKSSYLEFPKRKSPGCRLRGLCLAALLLGVAASSSPADVTVTQIGAWAAR